MIPLRDDNPTRGRVYITPALIVISVGVFLWQISLPQEAQKAVVYGFGVTPAALLGHTDMVSVPVMISPVLSMFTSMFLHGGWMHLIGNMLYLWIFGDNVEDSMGHVPFIIFYLLCGIAAVMAQALPNPQSDIPMIGASGAISGVLGAYLLLFPHARVLVLVPLGYFMRMFHLPAMFVLGLWFALQLINSALAPPGAAGVAWSAHIGGFVAGMALIPLFKRRRVRLFARRR